MRLVGLRAPINIHRIRLVGQVACKSLSTSLNRADNGQAEGSPKLWTRSELRQHVEDGVGGKKMSEIASQELKTMLHQVGGVLNRSRGSSDERLAMSLLDKHVFAPAQSHSLSPEILTLGMQILEKLGEHDKAIDLYYEQKEKGAVDAQHLTSLFRVLRMAVESKVNSHKKKWNNQSFKFRDSKQAMDNLNLRDKEIFALLAQALDVYKDAMQDPATSALGDSEASSSHIVANAILGVLMTAPKNVISANPELLEEALAVMLNLHRTEDGLEHQEATGDDDKYSLPVKPHRGIYGQLISLAGRGGMLPIALSLHENMVSEAELYPTIFTETCLLTALGDCGEYEMAHNLYEGIERATQDPDEGPAFGELGVRAVTKYMEICLASGDIGRGLQAFKNWRKHASERPTWYSYEVLHSLTKYKPGASKRDKVQSPPPEGEGEGDGEAPPASNWNPPGQWSDQRVAKEQSEALKLVTQAVRDGISKPFLHGTVPLSLLASEVGCHLIVTGHLDVIAETRLRASREPEVARCWATIARLLRVKGSWRDLLSLQTRLLHGHSDLNIGTKLTIFGSAAGAINASGSADAAQRLQWLWDSQFQALLNECLASDSAQVRTNEKFRFQQLFHALKGNGDGSSLVPFALEQILQHAVANSKHGVGVLHPRLLTDAIFNCTEAAEISLSLEVYSALTGEGNAAGSGKRALINAVTEVGIPSEDKPQLLKLIDDLY